MEIIKNIDKEIKSLKKRKYLLLKMQKDEKQENLIKCQNLASNMKDLRNDKFLSLSDISNAFGVSKSTIQQWENLSTKIPISRYDDLNRLLTK